jgi:hypothetical protein
LKQVNRASAPGLPDVLNNHRERLGWPHGRWEIPSREALYKFCDLADDSYADSVFDMGKLN